jgi:rhamnosyltransferase
LKFTKSGQIFKSLNTSFQQWLNDTLAVLVLYKTPVCESPTFISLSAALQAENALLDIYIYDNSPTRDSKIGDHKNWKITYRHDPSNPGVSKAYNQGFERAKQLDKKWLLLLDQDTIFESGLLRAYFEGLTKFSSERCFVPVLTDRKGIISPFKFRLGNGFRITSVLGGVHSLDKLQFINSGMMVHLVAFEKAQGFNEKLGLDFSDLAFIGRLKRFYAQFVVINSTGTHSLSSTVKKNWQEDLYRFMSYVQAAIEFKHRERPSLNLVLSIIPHALKLCLVHRTNVFLKVAIRSIAKRNAR